MTEWKMIPGLPDYEINENQEIRRVDNKVLKKFHTDRYGYLVVNISTNRSKKGRKKMRVHRLMALVFLSNPEKKPEVHHKDLNKLNNHWGNLEWVTHQEHVDKTLEQQGKKRKVAYVKKGYQPRSKKAVHVESGEVMTTLQIATLTGKPVRYVTRRLNGERPNNLPYRYV